MKTGDIGGLRDVAVATAFWDYISCTWSRMGDNDMMISYKGWLAFGQPLRLFVTLSGFVVATDELPQAGDCQVGN